MPSEFNEEARIPWTAVVTAIQDGLRNPHIEKRGRKSGAEVLAVNALSEIQSFLKEVFRRHVKIHLVRGKRDDPDVLHFAIENRMKRGEEDPQQTPRTEILTAQSPKTKKAESHRRVPWLYSVWRNEKLLPLVAVAEEQAFQRVDDTLPRPEFHLYLRDLTSKWKPGYFLVSGDGGVGKSRFLAQLLLHPDIPGKTRHQCFFFNAGKADRRTFTQCLTHLYYSLGLLHSETAHRDQLNRNLAVDKQMFVVRLQEIQSLLFPRIGGDRHRNKLFIFIDAVDEADRPPLSSGLTDVLPTGYEDDPIPENIRIVLSARNRETFSGLNGSLHVHLAEKPDRDFMLRLWDFLLDKNFGEEEARERLRCFRDLVVDNAEDSILYLVRVCENLRTIAATRPLQPQDIPHGVKGLFLDDWTEPLRRWGQDGHKVQQVWRTIALLRESLSLDHVYTLSGVLPADQALLRPTVLRCLDAAHFNSTGESLLHHKTFAEYVTGADTSESDSITDAHMNIAQQLQQTAARDPSIRRYADHHLIHHLYWAQMYQRILDKYLSQPATPPANRIDPEELYRTSEQKRGTLPSSLLLLDNLTYGLAASIRVKHPLAYYRIMCALLNEISGIGEGFHLRMDMNRGEPLGVVWTTFGLV